jgi:RNA polymerase sigma-70 factor (ECF subfamily)
MPKKSSIVRMAQDSFLVIRIAAGDEKAFKQLYDRYFKDIYRFIYFKVGAVESAEDTASDTFFKVWHYIKQGKRIRNVRALLYQTARNKIIDYYRKKQDEQLEEVERIPFIGVNLEEQTDRTVALEKVYAQLRELKEEYREVVELRYVYELSHSEIGSIIGKKSGAVRVLLHRALSELKKNL